MLSVRALAALGFLIVPAFSQTPDPLEIVRKAIELSRTSDLATRNYHLTQEVIERELDESGKVTAVKTKTYEQLSLYGEPYSRLIRRSGAPLSPEEEREEQQKYDEAARSRERESPEQRRRRLAAYEEKIAKRRQLLEEVVRAFTFRHLGDDTVDGMEAWLIEAKANPEYHPPSLRARFLSHMEGRFWISKTHGRLLKLDAVTTGPVSFGWVVARLGPGSRISFEQVRLDDDVWLMKRFKLTYNMRIALIRRLHGETEQVQSNFRRIPPAPVVARTGGAQRKQNSTGE